MFDALYMGYFNFKIFILKNIVTDYRMKIFAQSKPPLAPVILPQNPHRPPLRTTF